MTKKWYIKEFYNLLKCSAFNLYTHYSSTDGWEIFRANVALEVTEGVVHV